MPEKNYNLYSSENWFGRRFDQEYIKEGLGGILGNRKNSVKHY